MRRRPWRLCLLASGLALATQAAAREEGQPTTLRVRALTEPSRDLDIVSPLTAVIRRMFVKEGEQVANGQPLVQLNDEVQQAGLAVSQYRAKSSARIEAAQANLRVKIAAHKRKARLHERQVISAAELEEAELDMQYAQSSLTVSKEEQAVYQLEVKRARALLDERTIRAPVAGIIMRCIQDVGEAAREGEPLVRLVVLDVLHVIAYVPPAAAVRIRPGMKAQLELDDSPAVRHPCRVLVVDPVVDAGSATCRVKLELPNRERKVRAGSRGAVHFSLPPADKAPR